LKYINFAIIRPERSLNQPESNRMIKNNYKNNNYKDNNYKNYNNNNNIYNKDNNKCNKRNFNKAKEKLPLMRHITFQKTKPKNPSK